MKRPAKHAHSIECWCEPVTLYTSEATGCRVFTHRGPRGPILPPPDALRAAILWADCDDETEASVIEVP